MILLYLALIFSLSSNCMEEENNQSAIIPRASYYIIHKKGCCEFYRCNGFKLTTPKECIVDHEDESIKDKIQGSVACITFHSQEHEIIETQIATYSPRVDLHKKNPKKLDPNAKPKAIIAKIEEGNSPKKRRVVFYDGYKRELIHFPFKADDNLAFILNSPTILKAVDTSEIQTFSNKM